MDQVHRFGNALADLQVACSGMQRAHLTVNATGCYVCMP
jgi:broad specificity phosphatase PhoE